MARRHHEQQEVCWADEGRLWGRWGGWLGEMNGRWLGGGLWDFDVLFCLCMGYLWGGLERWSLPWSLPWFPIRWNMADGVLDRGRNDRLG